MPSLLDKPPHVVEVQLRTKQKGLRGDNHYVDVGERIRVACAVQPVREWSSAEERLVDGVQLFALERIFSRTWPGDSNSHIFFQGRRYEVVGDAQHNTMSRRTTHWAVTIRRIGSDKED